MKRICHYIKNGIELETALSVLADKIPCFITREYIEMDYSKVTVICREEDAKVIEHLLVALV